MHRQSVIFPSCFPSSHILIQPGLPQRLHCMEGCPATSVISRSFHVMSWGNHQTHGGSKPWSWLWSSFASRQFCSHLGTWGSVPSHFLWQNYGELFGGSYNLLPVTIPNHKFSPLQVATLTSKYSAWTKTNFLSYPETNPSLSADKALQVKTEVSTASGNTYRPNSSGGTGCWCNSAFCLGIGCASCAI